MFEGVNCYTACLSLPQQYANLEAEMDSLISHVSLAHVTKFVPISKITR